MALELSIAQSTILNAMNANLEAAAGGGVVGFGLDPIIEAMPGYGDLSADQKRQTKDFAKVVVATLMASLPSATLTLYGPSTNGSISFVGGLVTAYTAPT